MLTLFLKNIKVHSHKILILSVLQRGVWILIFIEDTSCSFLISSMNLKNLTRILHMWIGCCLDFLFLRDDSPSYKRSSVLNLSVNGLPSCLLDWYLKLYALRNLHIGETKLILQEFHHSHLLRVPVGNGTFESAVRALLKVLNSSGFFSPSLAECSFLWAALSGRNEIEDNLLSAVLFFWQLWALGFVGRSRPC